MIRGHTWAWLVGYEEPDVSLGLVGWVGPGYSGSWCSGKLIHAYEHRDCKQRHGQHSEPLEVCCEKVVNGVGREEQLCSAYQEDKATCH